MISKEKYQYYNFSANRSVIEAKTSKQPTQE